MPRRAKPPITGWAEVDSSGHGRWLPATVPAATRRGLYLCRVATAARDLSAEPALFRTFAHLAPADLQAFAEKWALLGQARRVCIEDAWVEGEPAAAWVTAIAELRDAVELWEDLRSGVRRDGAAHLTSLIQAKLAGALSPRLEMPGGWVVRFEPQNFLQALWVQFADAVANDLHHRQCEGCSRWLVIAPKRGREDKRYCGDTCRMRVKRRRWAEAEKRKEA